MIDHLDHLVLTTARPQACIDFYTRVLGLQLERFIGGTPPVERLAFRFGHQKINLHVQGAEFEPKAHLPVPGAPHWGDAPDPLSLCARPGLQSHRDCRARLSPG
jgi:catechol 2,3-dioxygenase-like lactoylglutathione lyase family enzyme